MIFHMIYLNSYALYMIILYLFYFIQVIFYDSFL